MKSPYPYHCIQSLELYSFDQGAPKPLLCEKLEWETMTFQWSDRKTVVGSWIVLHCVSKVNERSDASSPFLGR